MGDISEQIGLGPSQPRSTPQEHGYDHCCTHRRGGKGDDQDADHDRIGALAKRQSDDAHEGGQQHRQQNADEQGDNRRGETNTLSNAGNACFDSFVQPNSRPFSGSL